MRANGATIQRKKRSGRRAAGVPHLFDCWNEVSRRVRAAKEIRLFIDFDGTLAQHCIVPESVKLSGEMKAVLHRIVRHRRIQVGIMSGRRRATLQHLVRIPHIEFYGLYGWENGNGFEISPLTAMHLREILDVIKEHSPAMRGIQTEDKGASVAVHFRDAPLASRRRANRLIRSAVSNAKGDLRILETDSAWDVVPNYVQGKGAAIRNLLENVQHAYLPIYIGDDVSDEPALAELRRGITVRVGPARRTVARYRLRNSEEVQEFLSRVDKVVP